MNCYTYILYSLSLDKYYVGHTCEELEERIRKHLTNHKGFTAKTKDWELVYGKKFEDKSKAYDFELSIKQRKSRKYIEQLISSAG